MPRTLPFSTHPHQAFTAGFYRNDDFDFDVRIALGAAAFGASDAGEVLSAIASVRENDHDGWFAAWVALGTRVRAFADASAAAGHDVSASQAYLRASTYFAVAVNSVAGLEGDDDLLPTFRSHRSAWDRFVDTTSHAAERIEIPYDGSSMPGYFFRPAGEPLARPTFVMVNGSDGSIGSLWTLGAAGALARGYNVVMFDGPGQQSMLFERGIGFRPDWEAVVTPVVDFVCDRPDVDSDKLALYGVSQGGYWVPRALAFEHRFAAAVLDPGVVDVGASWTAHFPKKLLELLDDGNKNAFDRDMAIGMKVSKETAREWSFRARPYRKNSYFDTVMEVRKYTLDGVIDRIDTPLFIANPEDEQFWPGQPAHLADAVAAPVHLCDFTAAEGANYHCQPMARLLTDQRMFDWLDETLAVNSPLPTN
ncbi:alpha/beta hydrolase family protein [Rhodococcoides yunnanense]|uniref:alpha/beta hydrolase family protein n=1 Tax=Rhodococcoides yunnanense TaxID=278209 RepID=UPI0009331EBA|nr:prolyl oligopeptidase family serine peptidase [Rhodococcus yunnanensis]